MNSADFTLAKESQSSSVLFSRFPGEVRNLIYYHALSEYALPEDVYDRDTCYRRPGSLARSRTDTALLHTCQRVYEEAWFLPWTCRSHTLYLTGSARRPEVTTTKAAMESTLATIRACYGEEATAMNSVRVFAQLYMLEPGSDLQEILNIPHFNPKVFTICLRHTDWWNWEMDAPLRIESRFVQVARFPNSVCEVRMELESIKRRRPQIEFMAREMRKKWVFKRQDGSYFAAVDSVPDDCFNWEGSSTWNEARWLRDETKPETLEYHVQTIRFLVQHASTPPFQREDARHRPPDLRAAAFLQYSDGEIAAVNVMILDRLGIGPGYTADQVRASLHSWEQHCRYHGTSPGSGVLCCYHPERPGASCTENLEGSLFCNSCRDNVAGFCRTSHTEWLRRTRER